MSDECRFETGSNFCQHHMTIGYGEAEKRKPALCGIAAAALRVKVEQLRAAFTISSTAREQALEARMLELEAAQDTVTRSNAELIRLYDRADATVARLREALKGLADELVAGAHTLHNQKAILRGDRDWLLGKAAKASAALAAGGEA